MKELERRKNESIAVTYKIPKETNTRLHFLIEKKELSKFVSQILDEALERLEADLKDAYIASSKDPETKKIMDDFLFIDNEGWGEWDD